VVDPGRAGEDRALGQHGRKVATVIYHDDLQCFRCIKVPLPIAVNQLCAEFATRGSVRQGT
jgi:hypothetical protein